MRMVGVDPGTMVTGYGVIDFNAGKFTVLEAGDVTPRKSDPLPQRVLTIYRNLCDILQRFKPEVMVLEKIYAHGQRPLISGILGHARGVICLACAQESMDLVEYSVKRVRQSLTGNGNATKIQSRRVLSQLLNIDENNLSLDASDALALTVAHARMSQVKI
jgi:crossover junction endodeoxyribonuclease RuvC